MDHKKAREGRRRGQDDGEDEPLIEFVDRVNINESDHSGSLDGSSRYAVLSEEDNAGLWSLLNLSWVSPLMRLGYKRALELSDMFFLPKSDDTNIVSRRFATIWKQECLRCSQRRVVYGEDGGDSDKPSLVRALHHAFGWNYYALGILKFFYDGIGFANPILLNFLILYISGDTITGSAETSASADEWVVSNGYRGFLFAAALLIVSLIQAYLGTHYSLGVYKTGIRLRTALITSIYNKALSASYQVRRTFSSGEIVNLMSTDVDRVVNFCPSFHEFWSLPLQILVSLGLLYQQVQLAFLAGLVFALMLIPINRFLANKIGDASGKMMTAKDKRVRLATEILYGIRLLKLYAWEEQFRERLKEELYYLKIRKYLDAWCVYFWATTPVLMSILTFVTYVLIMKEELTAAKAFTSLSLFNMLIGPLNAFPWVVNGLKQMFRRIGYRNFFIVMISLRYSFLKVIQAVSFLIKLGDGNCVTFHNATFEWRSSVQSQEASEETPDSDGFMLKNINLAIRTGSLVMIIGKVGSGKSSILSSIMGEMQLVSGSVKLSSSKMSYVSQEPWIQNASFRDNVLFGKMLQFQKYNDIIWRCCLNDDLETMAAGDKTEIGENGINLSGGQKVRLTIARALYQDNQIYLLDDILSAVDSNVGKHLFHNMILNLISLKKTVIMTTNQLQYLSHADLVVVVENGEIKYQGPYAQLDPSWTESITMSVSKKGDENTDEKDKKQSEDDAKDGSSRKGLIEVEERQVGTIAFDVHKNYFRAAGAMMILFVVISMTLMQATRNGADWWLSYWVTESEESSTSANSPEVIRYFLIIYGSLAVANTVFALLRAFSFALMGLRAAEVFHESVVKQVLQAKISFFDSHPVGRLINRFSTDQYSIDDSLPFIANILLANVWSILGTLVVILVTTPLIVVIYIPIFIIYYFIQKYYRSTSREIKRLDSISRSPIYSHFGETINGIVTIRASNEEERFKIENEVKLNDNQLAAYAGIAISQWLNLRLQLLGVIIVAAISFLTVAEHDFLPSSLTKWIGGNNPGAIGLAIAYALPITGLLNGCISNYAETEKEMISVERASHYLKIDSEVSAFPPICDVGSRWPERGEVQFSDVTLRYRSNLDPCLKRISFTVKPCEKVGICGRTGAGKSSILTALFRIVEIESGVISIDGINTQHVPLDVLRKQICIIPQQPFLMSGTVRDNLDPFNEFDDETIWAALNKCHLRPIIERLPRQLYAVVEERGDNFSVGERQLVCLGRAILRRPRILCMDEATASVDSHTDALIQKTLRTEFNETTIITIAHRMNTILDYDKIIVVDNGVIAGFDSPANLKETSDLFRSFIEESNVPLNRSK